MKKMLTIYAVLSAILLSSILGYCQSDSIVDDFKTVDGNIVSIDVQNSQVVVKASEAMTFSVPKDAKIVNADGFGMNLSDVKVGNYVTVDYRDDKSGAHVMTGMEVEYNS